MAATRLVSLIKTPAFMLKEYLHRRQDPGFGWRFVEGERVAGARARAGELAAEGITLLPAHFRGERLAALQSGFDAAVIGRDSPYDKKGLLNLDFLADYPVLLEAAFDEFLLEIIAGYYGRKFALARTNAYRFEPIDEVEDGAYLWHHDARGRQVHVMVLLNDVPADGQRMTYLRGSHRRYYTHHRGLGEGSRFHRDVAADPGARERMIEVAGPAGTVGIFDANGLHTANRNNRNRRDAMVFAYVSYRHFKKVRYRREDVERMPSPKREVATFNPYCELVG